MQLTGSTFLILPLLVFVAVLLLFESLYLLWRASRGPEAKKLQSRLKMLAASRDESEQARLLKQRLMEELPAFERFVMRMPRLHSLDRLIVQAGLNWSVTKLVLSSAFAALLVWVAVFAGLRQAPLIALAAALAAATLPFAYVSFKRSTRLRRLEQQLPDALDLVSRGLRAGHAFSSTLKMAGEEMAEPIGGEFRIVHDEINYGVALPQALTNLCDRVPSTDVRYFVVAVLIQRESGGNLTEILTNLGRLIRERLKLLARVRVLCTEGKMSAWILCLLPFALAGLLNVFNPGFISPLWKDPIGHTILKYMLTMMLIGVIVLRHIIKIRV